MTNWNRQKIIPALTIVVLLAGANAEAGKKEKVREEVATIDTNLGRISFRFFSSESPKTVEAFKQLARAGFFDGTLFHRVLPSLMIQGGDPATRESETSSAEIRAESLDIEKNDLKHHAGTVSMAHDRDDPHSRNQFFIALQDVAYFDGKYTVIGEVISGLKVVEAISNVPRNLKQIPLYPVRVRKLYLEMQDFFKEIR